MTKKKKGFWKILLEVIDESNKKVERFQKRVMQRKVDRIFKKELKAIEESEKFK